MCECCRGSAKPAGVVRTVSAASETMTSSAVNATQMPKRTHSVQERHGQTVYLPSTDPVSVDISPSSVTVTPGATTTGPLPPSTGQSDRPGVTSAGGITVSAPAGVEVRHDANSRTFTLTFGVDDVTVPDTSTTTTTTTTTKVSTAQLIWQPPSTATHRPGVEGAPVDDVIDAAVMRETAAAKPPPLSRILTESTEEPPDTPTSPDSRKSQCLNSRISTDSEASNARCD